MLRDHPDDSSTIDAAAALTLVDLAPTGLLALDREQRVVIANPAARRLLGLVGNCRHGRLDECLAASGRLDPSAQAELLRFAHGQTPTPVRIPTADGQGLTFSRRIEPDGAVLLTIAPLADLPAEPAGLDALTGLLDREQFHRRLDGLCAPGHARLAVIRIDLERFHTITDSLGYRAGDDLLRLVAERLRAAIQGADLIGRLGAAEFAAAIPITDRPDLQAMAARLVSVLSRPYLVDRQSAIVGARAGVALAPDHGDDAVALIRAADLALRRGDADGIGAVRIYDEALGQRTELRRALLDDLRRAIPLQQLELHYQPQVCLETGSLTGFEALVRWRHPQLGMVGPDRFIPLAEESGFIVQIGEWVMFEACRQAAQWPSDLVVAVNVAYAQLLDRRLPAIVAEALARHALAPSRLEIEVTESALIDETQAFDALHRIRSAGIRISMDDFGTGYSSLSQLRRFPFDKLKIDRSFIRDLGDGGNGDAVVRAIAALGRSLGLLIVAEGVETQSQQEACRIGGCTSMQGYLVSRPVPADQVDALIQRLSRPRLPHGTGHG